MQWPCTLYCDCISLIQLFKIFWLKSWISSFTYGSSTLSPSNGRYRISLTSIFEKILEPILNMLIIVHLSKLQGILLLYYLIWLLNISILLGLLIILICSIKFFLFKLRQVNYELRLDFIIFLSCHLIWIP